MEKAIRIKATEDTPEVIFDNTANVFSISGRSLPEDASAFYAPLISWLKDYTRHMKASMEFHLNLDYFNSSSVKQILLLLMVLEEPSKAGNTIKIVWHYAEDDELMETKGQELRSLLEVPFESVAE